VTRYRLKIDAALEAGSTRDALDEIIAHFMAMKKQLVDPTAVVPNTFEYDSQIRLYPVRVRVVEEEIGADAV
jgi:hypothetical protein